MRITEENRIIHEFIGDRMILLSREYIDKHRLLSFDGNEIDFEVNAQPQGVNALVGDFDVVIQLEDLVADLLEKMKSEYCIAQRRIVKFPQLQINETDWRRFYSIFTDQELEDVLKRHVALSTNPQLMIANQEDIIAGAILNMQNYYIENPNSYYEDNLLMSETNLKDRYIRIIEKG